MILLRYQGYIFDFDGLILDTESPVYESWRELFEAEREELPLEVWTQCVGSGFEGYDPRKDLEKRTGKSYDWTCVSAEREARSRQLLEEHATPRPGVVEWLRRAEAEGKPCVVASSSPREWVVPWLERLELKSFFRRVITFDDTGVSKPAPDLFLLALKTLGLPKEEVLVIEDSLNGLKAAEAAGVDCLIVPNAVTKDLNFIGAWAVWESLQKE